MIKLPPAFHIAQDVSRALEEDIGLCDWTALLIEPTQRASAYIVVREPAVICGQAWVEECFRQVDATTEIIWLVKEGEKVAAATRLCTIHGRARSLLTAERPALNFLQTLCAVATMTRHYVDAVAGTKARILDTRKTIPGLRLAQKYAVCVGGGVNQRLGLYDGILIKENHILAAGSVAKALQQAKALAPKHVPIQIEVEDLDELEEALNSGATSILLDNMDAKSMAKAVEITAGRALLEASGGVDLDTIRAIAQTGVDCISIGRLTKDIRAIDLSLRHQ